VSGDAPRLGLGEGSGGLLDAGGQGDAPGDARQEMVLADTAGMPLAARLRPRDLGEFVGQTQAVGPGRPLRRMLDRGTLSSLVLWGPPGVGKTSLARVIAGCVDATWVELSAVTAGVKDVRRALEEGRGRLELRGRRTVLFIDEIHRFNKAQQDALLPGVEAGWVTLVGATTENPFFELNAPLLSRCQLVRLEPLEAAEVRTLLERAVADPERGLAGRVHLSDDALDHLASVAEGDARAALSALEVAASAAGVHGPVGTLFDGSDAAGTPAPVPLDVDAVAGALRRFRYDRASDAHYDQVSAFIKSIRGSDPDAAVYWLTRMLAAGEDARFLARRMVILASEDVGLADRSALPLAVAAFEALDRVGLPEARYALTHAAIALAVAPKSNRVTTAMAAADALIAETGDLPVPIHLRDTHNRSMRRWLAERGPDGRAPRTYEYPHDHPTGVAGGQPHLPAGLEDRVLYDPSGHGHEAALVDWVAELRALRRPAEPDR
jgi:putative ATPase